jgi:hypothetical protein
MANKWFRRRKPSEGTGYSIDGWKGLAAAVLFVVATIAVVIAIIVMPEEPEHSLEHKVAAGIMVMVVLIGGFVVFVVGKSGRR